MSFKTSPQNLVGETIPNVYIRSVTIDQSGGAYIGKETNPHIDVSEEPFKQRNRDGSFEWVYPPINYTSAAQTSNSLMVNVQLMIKDSNGGTWSKNDEVLKYLRVRVLESTDRRLTKQIQDGTYTLAPSSYGLSSYSEYARSTIISISETLKSSMNAYESVKDSAGNVIHNITFETSYASANLSPKHLTYFAVVFYDTEQMIEDYQLDLPDYLKQSVYSPIVMEAVIQNGSTVDKTAIYVVKSTGEVYGGPIHIYRGRPWTGSTHTTSSQTLRKQTVQNVKIQDNRKLEQPEEIQIDFSQVESELLGIQSDISKVSNDTLNIFGVQPAYFTDLWLTRNSSGDAMFMFSFDYSKALKEQTKFGKLMTSTDSAVADQVISRCKIRSVKVFRNRVIKKMTTNRLGNEMEDIVPIRINNFGSGYDFASPELIAYASQAQTGRMPLATLYQDEYGHLVTNLDMAATEDKILSLASQIILSDQPKRVGTIQEVEISVQDNHPGIRTFTGVDDSMSELTDGLYQYSVEVEVQDSTIMWFKTLTKELKIERNAIEEYYNESIDAKNYDRFSNKLKQSYIDAKVQQYAGTTPPYISAIAKYLEVMNILTFGGFKINNTKYAKSIYSIISPQSASPSGILSFIKIVNSLINRMEDLLGEKVDMTHSGAKNGSRASSRQSSGINTFKLEKTFNATFDSNVLKETGYDYLEAAPSQPTDGLKRYNGMDYYERCTSETEKYFPTRNANFSLGANGVTYSPAESTTTTEMTYLSPAKVEVNGAAMSMLDMGATTLQSEQYSIIEAAISEYNFDKGVPSTTVVSKTTGGESISSNYSKVAASAGVTLMSLTDYSRQVALEEEEDGLTPVRDYFNDDGHLLSGSLRSVSPSVVQVSLDNSFGSIRSSTIGGQNASSILTTVLSNSKVTGFAKDTSSTSMFTVSTPENSFTKTTNTNMQVFNLQNIGNGLELQRSPSVGSRSSMGEQSTLSVSKISSLPNQIKSLMLSSISPGSTKLDLFSLEEDASATTETEGFFRFNYQMLMQVEYLSGFGTSASNQTQLKDAQWEQLTQEVFNASVGKMLLCRMVKYSNNSFEIYEAEGLELPVYNEYFLITPESEVNVPSPTTIPYSVSSLVSSRSSTSTLNVVTSALNIGQTAAGTNTTSLNTSVSPEYLTSATVANTVATTNGTAASVESATSVMAMITAATTGGY